MVREATGHWFFVTQIPGTKSWITIKAALQLDFIHHLTKTLKLAASSNRPKWLYICPFFPDDGDIGSNRNVMFLECCVLIKSWTKSIFFVTIRADTTFWTLCIYRSTTNSGLLFRSSSRINNKWRFMLTWRSQTLYIFPLYIYRYRYRYMYISYNMHVCMYVYIYRVSQEEWTKLRESVPYVKLYRYNPKHLYSKLNGYGDNGQRSLKLWQLLHTYWLPNSY